MRCCWTDVRGGIHVPCAAPVTHVAIRGDGGEPLKVCDAHGRKHYDESVLVPVDAPREARIAALEARIAKLEEYVFADDDGRNG